MKKPKEVKEGTQESETRSGDLAETEPHDPTQLVEMERDESGQPEVKIDKEVIDKFLRLLAAVGPTAAAALLPAAGLGLMGVGSIFGLSGGLQTLVGMLAGVGAAHAMTGQRRLPDLAAPRFEDAIFQILQSDQSPVGFFVKDLSNKYVYVNLPMAKFLGKPASDAVGLTDAQLYPDEDATGSTRNLEHVVDGHMVHLERSRTVDGVPTILQEILVAKRGPRFEPVGVYGICWEVREPGTAIDLSGIDDTEYPSEIMRITLRECFRLAQTETHVLLTGEKGSGKDYLAQYIHDHSRRRHIDMVAVNCSEFTSELISSELFGHVKGAFTGAIRNYPGLIAKANGSTLFLNEIAEMPIHLQPKLLSFLEYGTYRQVGNNEISKADVRIIAATNRDLEHETAVGSFRADLYDRLNVFHVLVPPLKHRLEDIPILTKQLLARVCEKAGINEVPKVEQYVIDMFSDYDWPGNIRELKNVLERALVLSPKGPITRAHIHLSRSGAPATNWPEKRTEHEGGRECFASVGIGQCLRYDSHKTTEGVP